MACTWAFARPQFWLDFLSLYIPSLAGLDLARANKKFGLLNDSDVS